MHVAIRADGGPSIGFGHLVRAGAIAGEFLQHGNRVTFATTTPSEANEIAPDEIEILSLDSRSDPDEFVKYLEQSEIRLVITDAYPVDTAYQRAVQRLTDLAVVSDYVSGPICADALINGNLYAEGLDYEFSEGSPKARLLGPAYAPIRREIADLVQQTPPWNETANRAIVTMGGSDPNRLTSAIVRAFDGVDLTVDVIVGPGFSSEQEKTVRATAADIGTTVEVSRNPSDLPRRMFDADFAITTASSTTYELLALGTPIIGIPVADNQEPIAEALADRDLAIVLERDATIASFERAISRYVDNPGIRREKQRSGQKLVDGKGVERITGALTEL